MDPSITITWDKLQPYTKGKLGIGENNSNSKEVPIWHQLYNLENGKNTNGRKLLLGFSMQLY